MNRAAFANSGVSEPYGSPLISVIVPVYNQEAFLPTCIESLTGQTYRNLEILLINDCSADGSLAVIQRYAALDTRIVVIDSEKNCGTCASRNKGLALAKGEFIGFMDHDDQADARMFELLLRSLMETQSDVAVCGCQGILPDGSVESVCSGEPEREILDRETAIVKYLDERAPGHLGLTHWNKLYTKRTIAGLAFDEACAGSEDYWFVFQALQKTARVVRIRDVLYTANLGPSSIGRSPVSPKSIRALEAHRRILEAAPSVCPACLFPVAERYILAVSSMSLRSLGSKSLSYSKARRYIWRHIRELQKMLRRLNDRRLNRVYHDHFFNIYFPYLHRPIDRIYRGLRNIS